MAGFGWLQDLLRGRWTDEPLSALPFLEKLERAEEDVALVRLIVIAVNALAYLAAGVQGQPTPRAATAVLLAALVYSTVVFFAQVRPVFGSPAWSLGTVALDAVAISAWLAATGGWASPYFPVWYAAIAAVGYRYDIPVTNAVSLVYASAYGAVCALTGGIGSGVELGLRVSYIPVTGLLAGFASESYADAERSHRRTEHRLVEALETLDERFEGLLDGAPDAIVLTAPEGQVEYANHPPGDLGFRTREEGPARAQGLHDAAIQTAARERESVEYVASPEDVGSRTAFWCRAAPVTAGGDLAGVLVVARSAPDGVEIDPDLTTQSGASPALEDRSR